MPRHRASKPPGPHDPDQRPEQGAVERAIASILDRLKPKPRSGSGARPASAAPGRATRKPGTDEVS